MDEQANGKPKPRIRPAMSGGKYEYLMQTQADVTVTELAEIVEFTTLWPGVAMGGLLPQAIDVAFVQMSDGGRRHFAVREKAGIVLPGRG